MSGLRSRTAGSVRRIQERDSRLASIERPDSAAGQPGQPDFDYVDLIRWPNSLDHRSCLEFTTAKTGLYRAHSKFLESIACFARRLVPRWSIQLFSNYLKVGNVCLWICYLLRSWSDCVLLCIYSGWPKCFNIYHRKFLCILRAWC